MSNDDSHKISLYHFIELNELVLKYNFELILVGGLVRDYFLDIKNNVTENIDKTESDYDFELCYLSTDQKWETFNLLKKEKEKKIYESNFNALIKCLRFNYNIEVCNFNVIKLIVNNLKIELAPAREEIYLNKKCYGHSEFTIEFLLFKDRERSFKRRDFTVNALGIDFNNHLIDPFKGLDDLKNGVLNFCDEHFFKDPVRFVRLIRFQLKLNFSIHKDIFARLSQFDLTKLTHYYFFSEGFKSNNFILFLKTYLNFCRKYKIQRPSWDNVLDYISLEHNNNNNNNNIIKNKNDLVTYLISHILLKKDKNENTDQLIENLFCIATILGIKKKMIKGLLK